MSFFDVTCWRNLAENVSESISKGSRVIVYGRLDQRSWENQDGERRSKVEIVADDVAPSLKWATADLTRNEFRGGDSNSSGDSGVNDSSSVASTPIYPTDEERF